MIAITELAARELKAALSANESEPDLVFRLDLDIANSECTLKIDRKQDGDEVIEKDGVAILVMTPETSEAFTDATIDCVQTPEGLCVTLHTGDAFACDDTHSGCDHGSCSHCHDQPF